METLDVSKLSGSEIKFGATVKIFDDDANQESTYQIVGEFESDIENFYGDNNHHIIESCFKSFARSVRYALTIDERIKDIIPSSKGML